MLNADAPKPQKFTVGVMLYPDFDLLDVAGPYDVFNFFDGTIINRDVDVVTIAASKSSVASSGGLAVTPSHDFGCAPPIDLLFVPGAGPGITATIADDQFLDFLRRAASHSMARSTGFLATSPKRRRVPSTSSALDWAQRRSARAASRPASPQP